jgi:enoyl-CoA hydratase/carnithine racemase
MLKQNDAPRNAHADRQTSEPLLKEQRNAVLILTLNRPEARNCLSEDLLTALLAAFEAASADPLIRAIIVTGNGPVFCAGHDMKELTRHRADSDEGRAFYKRIFALSSKVMKAVIRAPKPVIAAVRGTATAAGCQLVASCDLAVAGEDARFCTPGVNIGLFCATPAVALSRNVPRKRAMEMLLLGEMIAATDAEKYGLVNRVAAPGRVMDEAMAMAEQIASKPEQTIAMGKQAFYQQLDMPLAEAYEYASEVMACNMLAPDAREGISAFLEKRKPKW